MPNDKNYRTQGPFHYSSGSVYAGELDANGWPTGPRLALADRENPETSGAERDDNMKRIVLCLNACQDLSEQQLYKMIEEVKKRKEAAEILNSVDKSWGD